MSGLLTVCLTMLYIQGEGFEEKSAAQTAFTVLIPLVVWYFGIRSKKKQLKNKLTFKQGFVEGFKISLVFGIVSPFIFAFFYLFVNPGLLEYAKTMYQMTDRSDMEVMVFDMLVQFLSSLIFGSVYGAIISFFLKTKSKKSLTFI